MLRKMGLIGAIGLAVAAFAACDDNPLAEDADTIDRFELNPTFANVKVGDSTKVNAIPVNIHGQRTGDEVSGTACDSKITIKKDPQRTAYEPPERFVVFGVSAGESCLTVSAGGKQATATIIVVQ
jgi:uncharacterized protein YjdB